MAATINTTSLPFANTTAYKYYHYQELRNTYNGFLIMFTVVGGPINIWMFFSILTSKPMRQSLRNILVCVILFNNMFSLLVVIPLEIGTHIAIVYDKTTFHCSFTSFLNVIRFMIMWIENWYIIIILIFYLATLVDFDITKRFMISSTMQKIGKCVVAIGPWIFCLIVAPSVMAHHFKKDTGFVSPSGCIYMTFNSLRTLLKFAVTAPFFIKPLLLVATLVAYYRRQSGNYGVRAESMANLTPNSPEIDDVRMFVSTCVLTFVCNSFYVMSANFKLYPPKPYCISLVYWYFTFLMTEIRSALQPLCFLFQDDICNRFKSWRPWYRPASGIDPASLQKDQDSGEK